MTLGVGLDIGGSAVTVAAVRARRGSLQLERYRRYELDALRKEGIDTASHDEVARAVVARLIKDSMPVRELVYGVSGRDAIIRYSQLPQMPAWRLALLMDYEVKDVAEKTGEALSADWRVLPGAGEGNLVLVALAKDARVLEAVGAWQRAGVAVSGAMPQAVATGDCYRFLDSDAAAKTTLVVDVGRDSTEVAIVEMGELIFARSVATGGEAFTERVQKVAGVDRDEAEAMKRAGDAAPDALAGPRQQLASMVAASVDFARQQLRRKKLQVERVVVSGGGSRVPGLVEAIGKACECGAAAFDPLASLDASGADAVSRRLAEEAGREAATAVGLALSACLPTATRVDILPNALKHSLERRHRFAPKVAAAALAALTALAAVGTGLWERAGQRSRATELAKAKAEVARRLEAHEERARQNERRESELRGLAERTRAGFHVASILQLLGAGLPTQLSLRELRLVKDERSGELSITARGIADNAQGDATNAMRALKSALEADPRVASTTVEPAQNQGATIEFTLTVVPTGNPAPAAPPAGGS